MLMQDDILQTIGEEYKNALDVEGFSNMMKDPSFCYKFYWLEAIVILISEGVHETTFNDLIDEMIANAWYSVTEFHVHLSGIVSGEVRDGLERAVLKLQSISDFVIVIILTIICFRNGSSKFDTSISCCNRDSCLLVALIVLIPAKDIQMIPWNLTSCAGF